MAAFLELQPRMLRGELQVGEARERAEHPFAVVVPVQGGRLQRARCADAGSSQLREVTGQARRRGAEALDGGGGHVGRQRCEGFEQVRARLRAELGRVREGGRSEILDTLIVYEWRSLFGPFTEEPAALGSPGGPGSASREAAGEIRR